jgi:hypothetical protein
MYSQRDDRRPSIIAIASEAQGRDLDNRRLTLAVILAVQIALTILFLFAGVA